MSSQKTPQADIGMIGLGVMGSNLALNMADHKFDVAGTDLSADRVASFVSHNAETPGNVRPTLPSFVPSGESGPKRSLGTFTDTTGESSVVP